MAEQKTAPTDNDVGAFLALIDEPQRMSDAALLVSMMSEVTGESPRMWGASIVGFGAYHYRYASGHEGDSCLVGFSPRAREFAIYLMGIQAPGSGGRADELLGRLGRHRMGKACLYVRRLADIDRDVLRQLIAWSVAELRRQYPGGQK